jgi:hypothetical protein
VADRSVVALEGAKLRSTGGLAARQLTILTSAPANHRATSRPFHCPGACNVTFTVKPEVARYEAADERRSAPRWLRESEVDGELLLAEVRVTRWRPGGAGLLAEVARGSGGRSAARS